MPKDPVRSVSRLLWALVLVSLPVTSFRFMPFMGQGTYVRPLALYPLVLLVPLLLFQLKTGRIQRPWPGSLIILIAFVLAALASSAVGLTFAPIELHGVDFSDRFLRAVVTLGIGFAFFLSAVWMNQTEDDLRFSARWLLVGFVADLAWGAVQYIGLNSGHRAQLVKIQDLFSVRGLVKNKRVSGFAYEPSWLAGQISAIYLPWLFASLTSRYHLTRFKWLEALLVAGGLGCILITYSRSGLAITVIAALVTFVLAGGERLAAFWSWLSAGFDRQHWASRAEAFKAAGSRILLGLVVVAILFGAGAFLANKGYIATLFKSQKEDLFSYAVDIYLGPRLAYATSALQAFQEHPFTGAGLGASGFYIYANMPDWVLAGVPEISQQLSPQASQYPNPKDLYVRLLAETGLVGFVLFMAFYLSLFAEMLGLLKSRQQVGRWLGAAVLFSFVAIILQGFSQDSFAMPEIWLMLGMLAGSAGSFYDNADGVR